MRKLMALAIVLVVSSTTRSWAMFGLGEFSFDGSLEYSGQSANNETDFAPDDDKRGRTLTRVRLGANTQVTEGVKGRLELVRNPASAGSSETQFGGTGRPTSVAAEESNFVSSGRRTMGAGARPPGGDEHDHDESQADEERRNRVQHRAALYSDPRSTSDDQRAKTAQAGDGRRRRGVHSGGFAEARSHT